VFGGDGLNVEPDTPVPNSEKTSKVDSTPVGAKRPPAKSERDTHSKKTGTRSR